MEFLAGFFFIVLPGLLFFFLTVIWLTLREIKKVVVTWKCKEDITKYTDAMFLMEYEKYRAEALRRMK